MKAYTVYQPYAHATVAGIKHYETRPRRTNVRGRVAVHAGNASLKRATKNLSTDEFWRLLWAVNGETVLPLGAVVGTVEIVDCVPVEEIMHTLTERERALGDFSPGRFAWVLRNPVMFDKPIPARGQQGWWNWEMQIKHIQKDKCGICPLIDWCGDPYEEPHFCRDSRFDEIEVKAFIQAAEKSKKGSYCAIAEEALTHLREAGGAE